MTNHHEFKAVVVCLLVRSIGPCSPFQFEELCYTKYKGVSIVCAQLSDKAKYQLHHLVGNFYN
jgi:hypothetical protein